MSLILPSPELQIIIRKEINEDAKKRDKYLEIIKEWMLQQPHLPNTWDDVRLMNCLRSCSFSLEKCKTKIDNYFSTRTALPEFYSNRIYSKNPGLQKICKLVTQPPMPLLTENGRRVSFFRINDDNEGWRIEDNFKILLMLFDLRLGLELNGTSGDIYVLDASTMSVAIVSQFTFDFVKKMVFAVLDSYPLKVKQIHVINSHPVIHTLFNLMKMFMKKKLRERVYMHTDNLETLYKYIPKESIPDEYGGNAGKLQDLHNAWIEKLKKYEPWFEEQENVKADESKRIGEPRNSGYLFGMEGSFAQLNID